MDFTAHPQLINKLYSDHEVLSNEQYIDILIKKEKLLIELCHSLFEDNIQMPAWKSFSETVIIKICFHISSLFQLFRGTEFPFKQTKEKILIFDEPSIYSLFRTITENYLIFYYLFVDNIPDEEKHFRFLIYEYCGLHQRQSFTATKLEHIQRQLDDAQHLEKLKAKIKESEFLKLVEGKVQKKIFAGTQRRLRSWKKLIRDAELNLGFDSNLYGYKSSYAHTEYLSLLQIKSTNYGFRPHQNKNHFVLFLIHMLISRMIINLVKLFPSIKKHYDKIDEVGRIEIEFLSVNLGLDSSINHA